VEVRISDCGENEAKKRKYIENHFGGSGLVVVFSIFFFSGLFID